MSDANSDASTDTTSVDPIVINGDAESCSPDCLSGAFSLTLSEPASQAIQALPANVQALVVGELVDLAHSVSFLINRVAELSKSGPVAFSRGVNFVQNLSEQAIEELGHIERSSSFIDALFGGGGDRESDGIDPLKALLGALASQSRESGSIRVMAFSSLQEFLDADLDSPLHDVFPPKDKVASDEFGFGTFPSESVGGYGPPGSPTR